VKAETCRRNARYWWLAKRSFLAVAEHLIARGWRYVAAVPSDSPFENALQKIGIRNVGLTLLVWWTLSSLVCYMPIACRCPVWSARYPLVFAALVISAIF